MEYKKLKELVEINTENITKNYDKKIIYYLDTSNITNGKIDDIVKLNIDEAPSRAKRIVRKNDIIYSTVRPNLCHYGILRDVCENMIVSTGFSVLRCKEKILPEYLYAYITLPQITMKLQAIAETSTSAYPSIKPSDLENIDILLPTIEEQEKISNIFCSIDKKIELNNKINDNLLKIIDNVYKEEFAELQVFDKAENIANITIGKTPPRSISECFSQNDCDIKWVSISDLGKCGTYVNNTSERLTRDAVEKYNVKIIPKETVILSFKLTVGRVAITRDEMTTNEAIAHFNLNNKDMKYFIYCYLKNFDFGSLGSTSSIATAVNSKIIKAMPIAIPDDEKLIKFNNIVNSLFEYVKNNEIENESLSNLRDTLLPKLMNGEIDLDKIEI